jgi:signal transduction histidine kinase
MLEKLKNISPWHFLWISIVASELITLVLSAVQGRLFWGGVSRETLIIGAVDALVVPLIVATLVIYFVRQTAELQKVNEQLQEANRKLQTLDRIRTEFISTASHELRTPLTTIKAFIELLIIKPRMPAQRKERLAHAINDEADRLTRLINDLLDITRMEEGSMPWRDGDLSMEEVIRSCLGSMAPIFEGKGLRVTTDIAGDLPVLYGDRDRFLQVMTNVLSNAGKFTPSGGTIGIVARRDPGPPGRVIVEVSDTGVGIPAADLGLIFEKFHRAGDHMTRSIEGSGLGLAISRQIIERHGGTISATSVQGKGSTFTISLPENGVQRRQPCTAPIPAAGRRCGDGERSGHSPGVPGSSNPFARERKLPR